MKKIFHFVSTNILSGLENMVINISTLVKGYDYTYVSPNGSINNYLNDLGIKHIPIKKMTPFYVRKVLKEYHPNIVHGHDVKASISLAMNHSICQKKNIKIISELHNDDNRMHKLSVRSLLYRLSSNYYNRIIVVSNSIINNYIFRNSIKKKTTTISNVVNPIRVKSGIKYTKNAHYKWDCIFMGRLINQKNPLLFVKLIYELKKYKNNISTIMLGDGPLKKSIIDLINKYNLKENIKLYGFKTNPYQYLNDSKILVMTSISEGLPLVSLESLIVGTPVVATPVGGLNNIIDKTCGYLAENKMDFVNKIYRLLFDEKLYNFKQRHTTIKSKRINNIVNFSKLYSNVYDSLN